MYRYTYTFDLLYSDHLIQGYLGHIFLCAQKHPIASLESVALQHANQNCGKHSNCCYGPRAHDDVIFYWRREEEERVTAKNLKQAESLVCTKNRTHLPTNSQFHDLRPHNTVLPS